MSITASPSINNFTTEWHVSASTTTELEPFPKIDWSFLFKTDEDYLREEAEKELVKRKENKMILKTKRLNLFTKKGLY